MGGQFSPLIRLPKGRRVNRPRVPIEQGVQADVGVEEDAGHPYFLIRSSSMIRSHSSSVGGGASVFNKPIIRSNPKRRGGSAITGGWLPAPNPTNSSTGRP